MKTSLRAFTATAVLLCVLSAQAQDQPAAQATPEQRVAMLKQWLQASQMQLRAYEWIETTVIAKDGEEKDRSQNTVYYSVDGAMQKIPVAAAESSGGSSRGGLPVKRIAGRAAERKKEELSEYMKSAAALIQSYVPPDANKIQQAVNGGHFAVSMIEPGRRGRLEFRDYLKSGDLLAVEVELPTNRLLGMSVSSYLDSQKDAVSLDVRMGVLPDGTIYTHTTVLNAQSEGITVTIDNTGHRRTAQ